MKRPKWQPYNRGWRIVYPLTKTIGWIYAEVYPGIGPGWTWLRKSYTPAEDENGYSSAVACGEERGKCETARFGMELVAEGYRIPKAAL